MSSQAQMNANAGGPSNVRLGRNPVRHRLASCLVALFLSTSAAAAPSIWQSEEQLGSFLIDEMHHLDSSKHYKDLSSEICPKVTIDDLNRLKQALGRVEYTEHQTDGFLSKRGDMVWRIARTESLFYS